VTTSRIDTELQLDLFTAEPESATAAGPAPAEILARTDYPIINLSGGKDGLRAGALVMAAAREAGVTDRVYSAHASLGPMEWPAVTVDGVRYPGSSELAAIHSRLLGIPPERHLEVRRTRELEGQRVPYDLLTFIAERGDWPWKGRARFCTSDWKTKRVFEAFSQPVRTLTKQLGRPVRCLNVLGIRADESADRKNRPVLRITTDNSFRIVEEWLPAHSITTQAVKDWTDAEGLPHHWSYDSRPGAADWAGSSRCSCSLCVLSSRRDLLLGVARRPRLAALYAEVEAVRRMPFNPNTSMARLIEAAGRPGAPVPGVVIEDEGPEFDALETAVRQALTKPPKRERWTGADRATLPVGSGCDDCALSGAAR
jgi:3'-phosphoadenosine 5'-phosphosulfate sulfotransferase (PAPS reductase)/FAD synthetase